MTRPGLLLFFTGMVALAAVMVYAAGDGSTTVYLNAPTQLAWQQTPPATYSNVVYVATVIPTATTTPTSTASPAPYESPTATVTPTAKTATCETPVVGELCFAPTATETAIPDCPVERGPCIWSMAGLTPMATEATRGER